MEISRVGIAVISSPAQAFGGFSGSGICGVWRVSNPEVGFDLLPYIVDLAENLT